MNKNSNAAPVDLHIARSGKIEKQALTSDAQEWGFQLEQILGRFPDLSPYGFYVGKIADDDIEDDLRSDFRSQRALMRGADFQHQVSTCLYWMYFPATRKTVRSMSWRGSYGLKHEVERWVWELRQGEKRSEIDLARYISNGAFIVAAAIDGWEPVRLSRSPNCRFSRGA